MAPDYVGIGNLILLALGAVGLIFVVVGAVAAPDHAKGALVGAGTYIALLVAAIAWMSITGYFYNRGIEQMNADYKAAAERSVAVLRDRCDAEERFIVTKPVALGSSVFVNLHRDSKPPTVKNAPPVVPTREMKAQQEKYGESFPPIANDKQFLRPISWIEDADRPEAIADLMHADLVDSRDRFNTYGKMYYRLATKQRWQKDGLSEVAIAYTERYIDDYKFRNWPDGKFKQRIPIDQPSTEYVFTVDDISTLEDRRNWLARGRIRLQDAATLEVVAEYTGFQSLLQKNAVCPNALKAAPKPTGEWDMLKFFFGRVTHRGLSH